MNAPKPATKSKRRSSEKRRQKATIDAKNRRDNEVTLYKTIVETLPLPLNGSKISSVVLLRISIAFIHLCHVVEQRCASLESGCAVSAGSALHGFFMIVTSLGRVLYVSDSIKQYLGLSQIEMLGSNIYDFLHQCDTEEVREIIYSRSRCGNNVQVAFLCRFRCTLSYQGTRINPKSSLYKVVRLTGCHTPIRLEGSRGKDELCLMAICEPIPHPSNIEIPLGRFTFLSRHDPAMIFTYCDEQMKDLVGYSLEDVLGKSVYEYHHSGDHALILKAYRDLFSKGQMVTGEYRFLVKHGGFVSVTSQSTVIYQDYTRLPQYVISVYFVLGGVQCQDLILSHVQTQPLKQLRRSSANASIIEVPASSTVDNNVSEVRHEDKNGLSGMSVTSTSTRKSLGEASEKEMQKLSMRAPSLPKGRDIQLCPRTSGFGLLGSSKMPIGATESVIVRTKVKDRGKHSPQILLQKKVIGDSSNNTTSLNLVETLVQSKEIRQRSILADLLSTKSSVYNGSTKNTVRCTAPVAPNVTPVTTERKLASKYDSTSIMPLTGKTEQNSATIDHLDCLNGEDYDRFTPISCTGLLHGQDLVDALDMGGN